MNGSHILFICVYLASRSALFPFPATFFFSLIISIVLCLKQGIMLLITNLKGKLFFFFFYLCTTFSFPRHLKYQPFRAIFFSSPAMHSFRINISLCSSSVFRLLHSSTQPSINSILCFQFLFAFFLSFYRLCPLLLLWFCR